MDHKAMSIQISKNMNQKYTETKLLDKSVSQLTPPLRLTEGLLVPSWIISLFYQRFSHSVAMFTY